MFNSIYLLKDIPIHIEELACSLEYNKILESFIGTVENAFNRKNRSGLLVASPRCLGRGFSTIQDIKRREATKNGLLISCSGAQCSYRAHELGYVGFIYLGKECLK